MNPQELREDLSQNLKKYRKQKGWSQFELAEKAEISEQTINSIEGLRLWPSDKTLSKIEELNTNTLSPYMEVVAAEYLTKNELDSVYIISMELELVDSTRYLENVLINIYNAFFYAFRFFVPFFLY